MLRKADIERMQRYSWPGNIRELQNVIERVLITSQGVELFIDLQDEVERPSQQPLPSPVHAGTILTDAEIRQLEQDNVKAALRASNGRLFGKGGAAEILGLKPTTLASRLKRLNIPLED